MFKFLRNCQSVFYSACTTWHSHQQCMSVLIFLCTCQYLLLSTLKSYSYPSGCEVGSWGLVVLICISLGTNDTEHFFHIPIGHWLFSLQNYLFKSFAHFVIVFFVFLWWAVITINCGKFWNRWEYQTTWPASWEICMQVMKQHSELDVEQQTGLK